MGQGLWGKLFIFTGLLGLFVGYQNCSGPSDLNTTPLNSSVSKSVTCKVSAKQRLTIPLNLPATQDNVKLGATLLLSSGKVLRATLSAKDSMQFISIEKGDSTDSLSHLYSAHLEGYDNSNVVKMVMAEFENGTLGIRLILQSEDVDFFVNKKGELFKAAAGSFDTLAVKCQDDFLLDSHSKLNHGSNAEGDIRDLAGKISSQASLSFTLPWNEATSVNSPPFANTIVCRKDTDLTFLLDIKSSKQTFSSCPNGSLSANRDHCTARITISCDIASTRRAEVSAYDMQKGIEIYLQHNFTIQPSTLTIPTPPPAPSSCPATMVTWIRDGPTTSPGPPPCEGPVSEAPIGTETEVVSTNGLGGDTTARCNDQGQWTVIGPSRCGI